jgi:hypothetical protein
MGHAMIGPRRDLVPSRSRHARIAQGLLVLALALAGCAETDPRKALRDGDFETAAALFQEQAQAATPLDPAWCRATGGRIEALAHYDKAAAKSEADAILKQHGAALGESRARDLADHLRAGGARPEAVEFLNSTVEYWPDSVALDLLHSDTRAEVYAKGGSDAKALDSLGYAGSESEAIVPRKNSKTPPEKLQPEKAPKKVPADATQG